MALCIFCSFLLLSLVFPWMGMKRAGFDHLFRPLGCWLVLSNISVLPSRMDAWRYSVCVRLSEREGFRGVQCAPFKGSLQLLISSHLRERDKMLLRAILCGGVWNGFPRRAMFPVSFVARKMEMVFCFLCLWIVVGGLVANLGMAGCLVLVAVMRGVLGLLLLVSWLVWS